jgi:hypothetical protein
MAEVVNRRRSLVFLIDGKESPDGMREWGMEGTQ